MGVALRGSLVRLLALVAMIALAAGQQTISFEEEDVPSLDPYANVNLPFTRTVLRFKAFYDQLAQRLDILLHGEVSRGRSKT
jgi:hypothetical protein